MTNHKGRPPAPFEGTKLRVPTAEELARENHVLELRRAGATFDRIAEQVHVSDRGVARRIYLRALGRAHQEPAAEIRQLESDRLDRLQLAVWQRALSGDLKAVDRVLRIMQRRASLLGLDHAHGVADRALQLEADRIRLVALAFGRALDAMDLTVQQREVGTRVLLEELRAQQDDENDQEEEDQS